MFKTVRAKITVGFSIAIVILVLLFGLTVWHVLRDYLIQMQQNNQERLAQSLCSSVMFFRENSESQAGRLLASEELAAEVKLAYQAGSGQADTDRADTDKESLVSWLNGVKQEQNYIKDIYVINQAYEVAGTGNVKNVRTYLIDRISTAERYADAVVWDSGYDTQSMMIFGKCPFSSDAATYYLFIQIDNSQILDLFHQFRLQNSQRFSLKGVTNGFEVTEQGFFYNYYDNYKELLHTELTIGDWHLRTWSDKSLIIGPAKDLMEQMALVLLGALAAALLLSAWLAAWITKPIKGMKETMERYGQGDFTAKAVITGQDEIAGLGKLLNQMSEQISGLFERVREEEKQSRRLELQTMVYQINPHFLYNTLDSVNVLARQSGDTKVAGIVTDLSRLFRLGLHQGREAVTVRDELMHVTYYLKIQKIRFDDQLTWEMNADQQLLDYKITKFILQPIVENAIYHGVKGKDEPGHIRIWVKEDGEFLEFCVEDTGNGMSDKQLEQLRTRIQAPQMDHTGEKGFGMWNVNQRIKLCYGDSCALIVYSEIGRGTRVMIRVRK